MKRKTRTDWLVGWLVGWSMDSCFSEHPSCRPKAQDPRPRLNHLPSILVERGLGRKEGLSLIPYGDTFSGLSSCTRTRPGGFHRVFLGGHVRDLMDLFQTGPSQASTTFQPTILVERSGEEGRKSNPLWGHFSWSLGLHKDTCPPVPVSAPLVNKQASRGKIIFSKSSSSWFLAPNWSFFFFSFFPLHKGSWGWSPGNVWVGSRK